jgi:hypothetical protein
MPAGVASVLTLSLAFQPNHLNDCDAADHLATSQASSNNFDDDLNEVYFKSGEMSPSLATARKPTSPHAIGSSLLLTSSWAEDVSAGGKIGGSHGATPTPSGPPPTAPRFTAPTLRLTADCEGGGGNRFESNIYGEYPDVSYNEHVPDVDRGSLQQDHEM